MCADDRRRGILDAGRHVFARLGFHGAGIADIAAAAGCSEPLLYRHFASKQALFAAVLRDATELVAGRVRALIARHANPLDALVEVSAHAGGDELFVETMRVRMLAATLVSEPEIRDALATTVDEMHERLTGLLASAQARGALRADLDPSEAAWLWFGATLAAGYRSALHGPAAGTECEATARALIRLYQPETTEVPA